MRGWLIKSLSIVLKQNLLLFECLVKPHTTEGTAFVITNDINIIILNEKPLFYLRWSALTADDHLVSLCEQKSVLAQVFCQRHGSSPFWDGFSC